MINLKRATEILEETGKLVVDEIIEVEKLKELLRQKGIETRFESTEGNDYLLLTRKVIGSMCLFNTASLNIYEIDEAEEKVLIGLNNDEPTWNPLVYVYVFDNIDSPLGEWVSVPAVRWADENHRLDQFMRVGV